MRSFESIDRKNLMLAFDLAKMTRCWVCGSPVIFLGPDALSSSKRLCSEICVVIDDQITPGKWIEASKEWPDDPPGYRPNPPRSA